MKLIEVKRAKEFASTFFADPVLKMAANSFLDHVPVADITTVSDAERESISAAAARNERERITKMLTEAANGTFGITRAALKIAVDKINEMEVPLMPVLRKDEPLAGRVYDYTECDGVAALEAAIRYINENGLTLISVTQKDDQYKVFFRRIVQ